MRASNSFEVLLDSNDFDDHSVNPVDRPGAARPSAPGTGLHGHDDGSEGKSDETFCTSIKKFGRPTTPAMAARKADDLWSTWEIAELLEIK